MKARPWTQEELDTLERMSKAKHSKREISEALKRTRGAVSMKVYEMGLSIVDPRTGEFVNKAAKDKAARERKKAEARLASIRPVTLKVTDDPAKRPEVY